MVDIRESLWSTAAIWAVFLPQVSPRGGQRLAHRHTLRGHSGPVVFVAWSPDGSKLATCGVLWFLLSAPALL